MRKSSPPDGRVYDREYGWCSRNSVTVVCTSCEQRTRVHVNATHRRGGVHCRHCGAMCVKVPSVQNAARAR
jgi:transcription elongation factor Elf1